jgi:aminopeptidase N
VRSQSPRRGSPADVARPGRLRHCGVGGAVLVLLAAQAAAQAPGLAITRYRITLDLPAAGDTIAARERVDFTRTPQAQALVLDAVALTVDGVRAIRDAGNATAGDGTPVPFAYDGRTLRVPLPPAVASLDSETIEIRYHGAPEDGLVLGVDALGRRAVFADNWPERARCWFPSVDEPAAKASVSFVVHAPAGWRVVANGARVAGAANAWLERHPVPTYTMVFGAGRFTVSEHRPAVFAGDTVPIEVWAYPEDSAFADSVPFRQATEIVEVLDRLVGPFPYEKLAHVEAVTRFGGMENASAIFYDERAWRERRMTESVVRHETAHQWFGDAVTERDWHDLWLSEGFATYFDLVVGAALHGDSLLEAGLEENAQRYFRSPVVGRPIVDSAEHDPLRLLNANNYEKGAWVLAMLRASIGDSAFWQGIRTYYRTFRDSTATSVDLERVMERAAGRPLGWFFTQWLRQPGYPMLACQWRVARGGAAWRATVTVRETQPEEWGFFRLPEIALAFAGPGVTARRVITVLTDTAQVFDLPFAPTTLQVDPDHELLLTAHVDGP